MDNLLRKLNPSKDIILQAKKKQILHFKEVFANYPHLEY
jgi:hypothetical protein